MSNILTLFAIFNNENNKLIQFTNVDLIPIENRNNGNHKWKSIENTNEKHNIKISTSFNYELFKETFFKILSNSNLNNFTKKLKNDSKNLNFMKI